MEIITGYRGEPHITSAQDRATNQGCFGEGSYILDVGSKLEPEIISANEIRINDGVLSHQGCVANIALGTYDSLTISNGSQEMKRADLIVARYTRDSETLVEDIELVVIEGTPASGTPSLPSYNEGNIQAGDSPVDMPLFRVNLEGVNIDNVEQIAANVYTQKEITNRLDAFSIVSTRSTNTTVASGSAWVQIDQVTISAGSYVIDFGGTFGADNNGYRQMAYSFNGAAPSSVGRDACSVDAVQGTIASMRSIFVRTSSSPTTITFWGRQNSGSSLTAYFSAHIIRIK